MWWNLVGLLVGLAGAFLLWRDPYFWVKSAPISVIPNVPAMTVWGWSVPRWLYNVRHWVYWAVIVVAVLFQVVGVLR